MVSESAGFCSIMKGDLSKVQLEMETYDVASRGMVLNDTVLDLGSRSGKIRKHLEFIISLWCSFVLSSCLGGSEGRAMNHIIDC